MANAVETPSQNNLMTEGSIVKSLLLFRSDNDCQPGAGLYIRKDDVISASYSSVLSYTMAELSRGSVVVGKLSDGTPAVFASGVNSQGMAMTDILVWQESGGLTNIAQDRTTGLTAAVYPYMQLKPQDIDGDGIIELPCPDADSAAEQTDGFVAWMSWKSDGRFEQSAKTYHCLSAGWYFTIPLSWWNWDVDALVTAISNENQMTLRINGDSVLPINTITGENRDSRSRMGRRLVLRRQTTTVYAGEVFEIAPYYGMDEDLLRRSFSLIQGTWNNS